MTADTAAGFVRTSIVCAACRKHMLFPVVQLVEQDTVCCRFCGAGIPVAADRDHYQGLADRYRALEEFLA